MVLVWQNEPLYLVPKSHTHNPPPPDCRRRRQCPCFVARYGICHPAAAIAPPLSCRCQRHQAAIAAVTAAAANALALSCAAAAATCCCHSAAKLLPMTLPSCRRCRPCTCSVALLPRPSCHCRAACAKLQKPPAATTAAIKLPPLLPLRCRRQAVATLLPPPPNCRQKAAAGVPSPSCRHPTGATTTIPLSQCHHAPAATAATLQLPPLQP